MCYPNVNFLDFHEKQQLKFESFACVTYYWQHKTELFLVLWIMCSPFLCVGKPPLEGGQKKKVLYKTGFFTKGESAWILNELVPHSVNSLLYITEHSNLESLGYNSMYLSFSLPYMSNIWPLWACVILFIMCNNYLLASTFVYDLEKIFLSLFSSFVLV